MPDSEETESESDPSDEDKNKDKAGMWTYLKSIFSRAKPLKDKTVEAAGEFNTLVTAADNLERLFGGGGGGGGAGTFPVERVGAMSRRELELLLAVKMAEVNIRMSAQIKEEVKNQVATLKKDLLWYGLFFGGALLLGYYLGAYFAQDGKDKDNKDSDGSVGDGGGDGNVGDGGGDGHQRQ